MKKTLRWSILFCLLLLCVMIPVTAQRAWAADYDLWVGGKQANSGNLNDILGDGTGSAKFDPDSNTLTLKDPKITAGYDLSGDTVLVYSKDIDLTVQGTAELKLAGAAASVYIEGGGLTVTGEDTEITAEADRTGRHIITAERRGRNELHEGPRLVQLPERLQSDIRRPDGSRTGRRPEQRPVDGIKRP